VGWRRRPTGRHTDELRDALVALLFEQGDAEAALAVRSAAFETTMAGRRQA
jgi:hypothetical protein